MAGAIVLSAFLKVVSETTASLLIQQFGGIWGADVHKELTKLKETLETVQAVLEDAEDQQLKSRAIRLWLSKLKDAAYEVDDILDEFQWEVLRKEAGIQSNMNMMVRRFFSSENPLLFRITMGRRIREIAEKFDVIAAQKSNFHLNPMNHYVKLEGESSSNARTETHSFVVEQKVVGRRDDIAKIVEMLIGQQNSTDSIAVLPIVGMGGLGKTTVAQMVYNEPRVRQHFQLHMWICVSEDFNVSKLAKAILEEAAKGNQLPGASSSMESLQKSLREMLSSKRYLLVLDDMWNEVDTKWEELKDLLSFGARGSVVVTTTRSEKVGSIMGTFGPYRLSNLSEDECWDLFKQRAFAGGREEDSELVQIGKRIVNKFGGLPLAAKTVGSLMRFKKDKTQWLAVLNNELWDMSAGVTEILPALKLSYNHLPPYLKQCFAYCAIFPKDYLLQDGILIQLWMANGLIPSQGNIVDLEEKGHEIFNDLASRSFFQDVMEVEYYDTEYYWNSKIDCITTKTCKMHDLIHDLATNVMGNECCILESTKHLDTSLNFKSVLHLTINDDRYLVEKTIAETTRKLAGVHTVLNLKRSVPLPGQFLWNSLRVLHWKDSTGALNIGSICKLKHLRYLDLSGCKCVALPEGIASLFHLQTLKLEFCKNLRRLPQSMRNMKNLRHLYLKGSTEELHFMPGGMGTLSSLRTLSDYVVDYVSGSIGELKILNSIGGSLCLWKLENVKDGAGAKEANLIAKEKLTSLELSWKWNIKAEKGEEVVEALQPHQNIRSLSIRRYGGLRFPNWLMKCPLYLPNLVKVILTDCIHCEHPPQLGQLLFLNKIKLSGMNTIKYMGGNTFYGDGGGSIVFPRLKKLKINNMPNLEEWQGTGEATGGAQVTFFPQLTELTLEDCPKLKIIPCIPSIRYFWTDGTHLLPLEKRFFENMKLMERLGILNCNQQFSLRDILTCDLSSLREIDIRDCPNLIDSSSDGGDPQQQHQYLTSLQGLTIDGSEKLACLPQYIGSLSRLKYLTIGGCNNLASLGDGLGDLMELERLSIYGCPKLITFPDELGLLPALSTLHVSSCGNLTTLPEGLGGLNRLTDLTIFKCPKLTSLPNSLLQRLSNLRKLQIFDCHDDLQRQFGEGGVHADIVSNIPYTYILPNRGLGAVSNIP